MDSQQVYHGALSVGFTGDKKTVFVDLDLSTLKLIISLSSVFLHAAQQLQRIYIL